MSKIVITLLLLLIGFLTPKVHAQILNDCPLSPIPRTDPTTLYSDPAKTPNATFFVNVGDNKDYPKWKMQFECGIFQSESDADNTVGDTEISRKKDNDGRACEFFAGNHTLKVIAVT